MQRTLADALSEHVGETVRIAGWAQAIRRHSRIAFIVLRDRTGVTQIVVEDGDMLAAIDEMLPETVLSVTGKVVESAQAPGGRELAAADIAVISAPAEHPPLELRRPQLKEQLPTILNHAALSLRHLGERAKFQIAAASMHGFRETLRGQGFTEIQTPKLVESATESGANVFKIDYFGRDAYLAQSPQLYKQIMVGVYERVFETGPVFRAEPHDTPRHLAEYVSLDVELGFIDDHHDVMRVARDVVAGMAEATRELAPAAVELLKAELPVVPAEIPVVDFEEGQRMIEQATGEEVVGEPDLAPAHERWLCAWAKEQHDSDLLFVSGYPMSKRPFYTHPDPDRPSVSKSFDLLLRGVELITGGQRLHRYEDYLAALAERGQSPEPIAGYLQAFKYGMPPHGGFAIGLERWVQQTIGVSNIREATLFPRDIQRLSP